MSISRRPFAATCERTVALSSGRLRVLTRDPAADRLDEIVEVGCERASNMMLRLPSRLEIRQPAMQILVVGLDSCEFLGGSRWKVLRFHGRDLASSALYASAYSAIFR
jgi:hypothetical protein